MEGHTIGGNQEEVMFAGKFGNYKGDVEENDRNKGKASAKQGGIGKTPRDIREIEGSNRNENVSARPNGLRENAEAALLCR